MKKILIITQVVDRQHPILGFFHRWIEEFAKHCERVQVIALQVGDYDLPTNVTVHSLGKEAGKGRIAYLWRFYRLIYSLRHEYDSVFVHMNQIYVILGGALWRIWGKKIGLWYMHGTVSSSLRLAEWITHQVFTGSLESFRISSRKAVVTGHGIDTNLFSPHPQISKDIDCITVGRITPSKNLHTMIEQFHDLPGRTLTIVGRAVTPAEQNYENSLRRQVSECGLDGRIFFYGSVSQVELPALLRRAKIFLHTASNGSLDKSILEALSCGLHVITTAPALHQLQPALYFAPDVDSLKEMIRKLHVTTENFEGIDLVTKQHSLTSLIPRLLTLL